MALSAAVRNSRLVSIGNMTANEQDKPDNPQPMMPLPEHGGYYPSTTLSHSQLPASSSHQHLATSYNPPAQAASPFVTPFDDHVYPTNLNMSTESQTPVSNQVGFGQSQQQLSNPGLNGLGRISSDEMTSHRPRDDIPLQHQSQTQNGSRLELKDGDGDDHVHDAPQRKPRRRRRGVSFGELGMLGANSKRIPWVVLIFTVVQVGVFIGEIVKNATTTGSLIEIHPSFNPMIGPSPYILINMGARFVPCMQNLGVVQGSTQVINWPCPNTTTFDSNDPSQQCTLSELCGFGGVPEPKYDGNVYQSPQPNQWFRFIIPIFMHAGLVHIGFNLLLQLTLGKEMERSIGSIRFSLVYISAGIFGFVMGGNFAATGISSTGASGSLFGVIALTLLDLLYSWKDRRNPVKDLMFIMLDVVISFVLGLLPGLDNFSHIGGFLMGLAFGLCVLHSPNALRRRIGEDEPPYLSVQGAGGHGTTRKEASFFKTPLSFFKGRKPLWWAWWFVRAGSLVLVFIVFILLLNNFYVYHKTCSWCKYLTCLPVNGWCDLGNLEFSNNTKRDLARQGLSQMVALHMK